VLALDPENLTAHHNLALLWAQLGDADQFRTSPAVA
jgi:hypothetical protein